MLINLKLFALLLIRHLAFSDKKFDIKEEQKKFKIGCLHVHNILRLIHGAPPLKWSDRLHENSQAWANHLNTIQKMEHNEEDSEYGSNIYAVENPKDIDLLCVYAVAAWYKEVRKYDFNNPVFSMETGHFTQMVWKNTEIVGIGESGQADGKFFVVAKYHPPGNYRNEFTQNVLKARKIPSSCISKVSSEEFYKMLKERLGSELSGDNEYVYESDEPCVLPTRDTETEVSSENTGGTTPTQEGAAGTQRGTSTGTLSGTTGSQGAKPNAGTEVMTSLSAIPNKIILVPVSESTARALSKPQIILAPAQQVTKKIPDIIMATATKIVPSQPLPPGNGVKKATSIGLPLQSRSMITSLVSLNNTVRPLSSSISPTVCTSITVTT